MSFEQAVRELIDEIHCHTYECLPKLGVTVHRDPFCFAEGEEVLRAILLDESVWSGAATAASITFYVNYRRPRDSQANACGDPQARRRERASTLSVPSALGGQAGAGLGCGNRLPRSGSRPARWRGHCLSNIRRSAPGSADFGEGEAVLKGTRRGRGSLSVV